MIMHLQMSTEQIRLGLGGRKFVIGIAVPIMRFRNSLILLGCGLLPLLLLDLVGLAILRINNAMDIVLRVHGEESECLGSLDGGCVRHEQREQDILSQRMFRCRRSFSLLDDRLGCYPSNGGLDDIEVGSILFLGRDAEAFPLCVG